MHISDIYKHFCLPKPLQEHMIRVGAVALSMLQYRKGPVLDQDLILDACLLHDLGNIDNAL